MGRRGPKPTPSEQLKARGSWRGHVNDAEPRYPAADGGGDDTGAGAPPCPDWLDERAKAYWAELAPMLLNARVLKRPDVHALARYCQLLSRWRRCEEFIQKNGDTYPVRKDGEVVGVREFPQVRRASDLAAQLVRLEAEFGLTPSSRSRVIADEKAAATSSTRPAPAAAATNGPPVLRIAQ